MKWKIRNWLHSSSWFSLAVILQALLILLVLILGLIRSQEARGTNYSDKSMKSEPTMQNAVQPSPHISKTIENTSTGAEMCGVIMLAPLKGTKLKSRNFTGDYLRI